MAEWVMRGYGAVLRRVRPYSGLTRLSFNAVTRRLMAGVTGPRLATTAEGVSIEVDPHDYHGRIFWLFGSNDFKVARAVTLFLSSGDLFLDIGANYSTIGLAALPAVGPEGHVHLFEPQPHIADAVVAGVARAGLQGRVTMHRVALFDRDDTLHLRAPVHHSGMATVMDHGTAPGFARSIQIPAVDTAGYVAPLVGDRPFGVKIDIEGAELQVLPGLVVQPAMRFCVFEAAHRQDDLLAFFQAHGFRVLGLKRSVLRFGMVPVAGPEQMVAFHDYVAVRPDAVAPDSPAAHALARAG
ncbi:MAG: FkbM family methyltransferase [Pseudomonadota bacterium]